MFQVSNVLHHRKAYIDLLIEKHDYVSIFTLIEKCFRFSFFLNLYEDLNKEEFISVFSFIYSNGEYNFDYLLEDGVLDGALSWSLDYDMANFFARRFNAKKPQIYKAKVNVNDILLFLENENEILVEPSNVQNVISCL